MDFRHRHRLRAFAVAALCCAALTSSLAAQAVLPGAALAAEYAAAAPIPFLLLPSDNPWNTAVDGLPTDPDSADYIAHMSPGTGLHPDFGTMWDDAPIGIPYIVVPGDQPKVPVSFEYDDESDPGPYPIPANAPIEGGATSKGDRHVLVLDADNKMLYELYAAYRQSDGSWKAGSGAVFDLTSDALRPDGWTSADAAGLPILPGLARYDEIVGEQVLDHALRFTVAETQKKYVYPATHYASDKTDTDLPPMGLRVRLRAGFDVSGFPSEVQVILRGLKKYGMMVADNGSDWYVSGAPDPRWSDDDLRALGQVKGRDFEVIDSRALLPAAFYISVQPTATVREGARWTTQGSFFAGAGAVWTATADYGAGAAPLALSAAKAFTLTQAWADNGRRNVRVVVSDELARTAAATAAVNVTNVAPVVRAGRVARVAAGARFSRRCSFGDPGADTWSGRVSWGDRSKRTTLRLRADKSFSLSHRFPRVHGRTYAVVVTIRDDDGGRGTGRFKVTVR